MAKHEAVSITLLGSFTDMVMMAKEPELGGRMQQGLVRARQSLALTGFEGNGLEVGEENFLVVEVGDKLGMFVSEVEVALGGRVEGQAVSASEGFVGVTEIEGRQVIVLADRQTTVSVVERRLGSLEHRIDARDLPLADAEVGGVADLAPMITGGVRTVDHGVGIRWRAVGLLHERPRLVEEVHSEAAVGFGGNGSSGHRSGNFANNKLHSVLPSTKRLHQQLPLSELP